MELGRGEQAFISSHPIRLYFPTTRGRLRLFVSNEPLLPPLMEPRPADGIYWIGWIDDIPSHERRYSGFAHRSI